MLKETNVPEIQKAADCLHKMSADDEMRELARLREKAIRDERSAMSYARREGEAEGLAKGEVKGMAKTKEEIRLKMRSKGYTDEEIRDILN